MSNRWISWARRCRIPAFVKLQDSIVKHRRRILAAIEHNLSIGLIESINTKIRLSSRRGQYGRMEDAVWAVDDIVPSPRVKHRSRRAPGAGVRGCMTSPRFCERVAPDEYLHACWHPPRSPPKDLL